MRLGHVYIAQAIEPRWVKVGWAVDVVRRLCVVSDLFGVEVTLLGSMPGTHADETRVRRQFRHNLIAFDWHVPAEDLIAFAREMPGALIVSHVQPRARSGSLARLAQATGCRRGPHVALASGLAVERCHGSSVQQPRSARVVCPMGIRLRHARLEAGLTARELDRRAGRAEGHASLIESGAVQTVIGDTALSYANVLGVDVAWPVSGRNPIGATGTEDS